MHYIRLSMVVEEDERGGRERERERDGEELCLDPINRIVLQHN